MKSFSNFIFAFILAIATAFLAYAFSRMLFNVLQPSEVELQENFRE